MAKVRSAEQHGSSTSIDKALDVCEALAAAPRGLTLTDLARQVAQPRPSVHRLLGVLRRRGYVSQDADTPRYTLTLRMLDLSYRLLGRSELRLFAYPVLREFAARSVAHYFVAVPALNEVTYTWRAGADAVAMRPVFGTPMPAHCAAYFDARGGSRRLQCLRLPTTVAPENPAGIATLAGEAAGRRYTMSCACAAVRDHAGHEVARVGVFGHGPDGVPLLDEYRQDVDELGHAVSLRLGYLPQGGWEGRWRPERSAGPDGGL